LATAVLLPTATVVPSATIACPTFTGSALVVQPEKSPVSNDGLRKRFCPIDDRAIARVKSPTALARTSARARDAVRRIKTPFLVVRPVKVHPFSKHVCGRRTIKRTPAVQRRC
jgi:hypothetical protein